MSVTHPLCLRAAALCAVLASSALAQDARPVAFTNARLITVSGPVIEKGTLLVRNGKIAALGADIAVPAGARVVDLQGGTLMPGLVSAFSRAGLVGTGEGPRANPQGRGGRRGGEGPPPQQQGPGAQNQAATRVIERLHPYQTVFRELLETGVTSLALTPVGNGLPGQGAVLRPDGKTLTELTVDGGAFLYVGMARDSGTKKLLKESFEKAAKVVEERKKPPAPPPAKVEEKPAEKPAEGTGEKPPEKKEEPKPAEKPAEAKPEAPKQEPKAPPKDPNVEVLADLLEGKRRAVVTIDSAADLLHWRHAVGADLKFPRVVVAARHDQQAGSLDTVLDDVKKLEAPVLLAPQLSSVPRTRHLTNPAAILHQAGVEVGFVLGDSDEAVSRLFYQLMELVRSGLPADVALKGVTLVPAKALGIDKEVGTLEVGKAANLLQWSGDPLDPTSALRGVWLHGEQVAKRNGAER